MIPASETGIARVGLDADFDAEETKKSNLLLQAALLRAQNEEEQAVERYAEAAQIEERLAERCKAIGLWEKSRVHSFSAASAWAQAGDFYHALHLFAALQNDADTPSRLRDAIGRYTETLATRRRQWTAELAASER